VDVLLVPPVVVGRDRTRLAPRHLAGRGAEGVPDGRGTAVGGDRPFDLVRRGGRAPPEARRERQPARPQSQCQLAHAFSAPCMMPSRICRPSTAKTIRIGTMPTSAPARTSG